MLAYAFTPAVAFSQCLRYRIVSLLHRDYNSLLFSIAILQTTNEFAKTSVSKTKKGAGKANRAIRLLSIRPEPEEIAFLEEAIKGTLLRDRLFSHVMTGKPMHGC